eukprot:2653128-Pyramimonas_sp.AAC.1
MSVGGKTRNDETHHAVEQCRGDIAVVLRGARHKAQHYWGFSSSSDTSHIRTSFRNFLLTSY